MPAWMTAMHHIYSYARSLLSSILPIEDDGALFHYSVFMISEEYWVGRERS